jgi:hypothetical protein
MTPIRNAPITGPIASPMPPWRLTPPTIAAAIADNSMPMPRFSCDVVIRETSTRAARPAQNPEIA